jgi:hypothetical protein
VAIDLQKAIARLKPAQVRAIIDAALRVEPDDFDDLPAPQVMLRGDGWTGVTTTIDADGYRAVLITAGGRRTSSRTCTIIDPEGSTIGAFGADETAVAAVAVTAGLIAPRLLDEGPVTLGVLGAGEARAQAGKPLVMVNWGGLANQGFGNFYGAPFVADCHMAARHSLFRAPTLPGAPPETLPGRQSPFSPTGRRCG